MEFLTKKQAADECGPADAITPSQIRNMLRLANVGKHDVFYDLGSGNGRVVRMAVIEAKAKEAIGIENDADRFCRSRIIAKRELTKKQLKRIDFVNLNIEEVDFSDATVVYEGHDESKGERKLYKSVFKNKRVKIVKRDLPLVSYRPFAVDRTSVRCWFFLMLNPLHKYKTRNRNEWASHVIGKKNASMKDVYTYYDRQMKKRGIVKKDRIASLRNLKKLVRERF